MYKKVNMSKLTATRLEDIYVPSLWYYGSLSFLATECEYSPDNCTIEIEDSDESMEHENNERNELSERNENQEPETSPVLPKKIKEEKLENIQPKVETSPVEEKPAVQIKDEDWDILGKSIAIQLRDIMSKKQFIITQKLISDAIYFAKMGLLSESSQISLETQHPKTPQHEMPSTSSHRC
ncbi:uncharacterized protein LOC115441651 isoform X2 [Manduca sexta]|uniref:uncharacterized protein LOC115441651 isoform X2 n=1 Tax=Manduca sexta TaxID=7130 RepID=UPI001890793C|nr:uncharacterized protein LOC115441651 isoform X2 [Manduca sexta]